MTEEETWKFKLIGYRHFLSILHSPPITVSSRRSTAEKEIAPSCKEPDQQRPNYGQIRRLEELISGLYIGPTLAAINRDALAQWLDPQTTLEMIGVLIGRASRPEKACHAKSTSIAPLSVRSHAKISHHALNPSLLHVEPRQPSSHTQVAPRRPENLVNRPALFGRLCGLLWSAWPAGWLGPLWK